MIFVMMMMMILMIMMMMMYIAAKLSVVNSGAQVGSRHITRSRFFIIIVLKRWNEILICIMNKCQVAAVVESL